ncbi:hypothetical protein R84B8_02004 [Treponema sp. R8-4-B8]
MFSYRRHFREFLSGNGDVYLGGVIGYAGGSIKNSNISGTIRLIRTDGTSWVGGVIGKINGSGFDITNCHSLKKSPSNTLSAYVNSSSSGTLYIGGFVGEAYTNSNIKNCSSAIDITVPFSYHQGTGPVIVGGFCGSLQGRGSNNAGLENCFSSGNILEVSCNSTSTNTLSNCIGGLVGLSYGSTAVTNNNTISQCYATGGINAYNTASGSGFNFRVGGLVGLAQATDISECYATGNVIVQTVDDGIMPIIAGGLVGFLGWTSTSLNEQRASINDCYATGNVTSDNGSSSGLAVYSGGLVGYMQIDAAKAVTHSFATGTVIAKNSSTTTAAYAGGIVGYMVSGLLNHNAALNALVVAKSGNTGGSVGVASRIYNTSTGNGSNNYALSTTRVGTTTYSGTDPSSTIPDNDSKDGAAKPDGKNTLLKQFRETSFWIDPDNLAFNMSGTGSGLGALSNTWDFLVLTGRGYPKLMWE